MTELWHDDWVSSVDQAIDGYLNHLAVERGTSPNTLAAYRRDLRRYGRYLTARGIGELAGVTPPVPPPDSYAADYPPPPPPPVAYYGPGYYGYPYYYGGYPYYGPSFSFGFGFGRPYYGYRGGWRGGYRGGFHGRPSGGFHGGGGHGGHR